MPEIRVGINGFGRIGRYVLACLARSCPSPLGVLTRHLILHFLTSYTNSLVLKAILEHPNKDVKVIAINDPFIEVAYGVRKFFHLASVSQLPWET
jgi:glyceraldehyde-3-phosphate dehydrogenase/erythrose-4-phosphate dehydrogenase